MPAKKKQEESVGSEVVELRQFETKEVVLRVKALDPEAGFLSHRFDEVQREKIRNKKQKKVSGGYELSVPEEEAHRGLYIINEKKQRFGILASAFKEAMVRVVDDVPKLNMVTFRKWFFIKGVRGENDHRQLVEIQNSEPVVLEHAVKVGQGRDLRYRCMFPDWEADLHIQWRPALLSLEQVVTACNTAGFSVGVGDWRPEKKGEYGRFYVVGTEKMFG